MSIQTELTRLTNAKAAIQTAIEGKGVTVPSGTLLDGMAALIESIEAGGGNIVFGSFVPSDSSEIIIENAFPYDYAPAIFGVCEFSPLLDYYDTSHAVTRLHSLIAKGFDTTANDKTYLYSIISSPANKRTPVCENDVYRSFAPTFRPGNSLYNLMEGIIDGATRNLRFKPLSGGGALIAGRTYYYFLIFRS